MSKEDEKTEYVDELKTSPDGESYVMRHVPECEVAKRIMASRKGPSSVVSNAYRTGYETIFGQKQAAGEA